jgi:hypothetical protein
MPCSPSWCGPLPCAASMDNVSSLRSQVGSCFYTQTTSKRTKTGWSHNKTVERHTVACSSDR